MYATFPSGLVYKYISAYFEEEVDLNTLISLIRRCKRGDRSAFEQLLQMHDDTLYKVCFGYVRNREKALDIMQEVYIKIFQAIHIFDESRPLLPWMKKITVNTCLNYRRDHQRHKQMSLDDDRNGNALAKVLASDINIEEIACARDIQQTINRCIRLMPDKYKMPLTLRYIDEMSYAEIADILEQPLGTVKSNLARGRIILRNIMEQYRVREV